MAKSVDLSNVKPAGLSFYNCTICLSNSDGRPARKMIKHLDHDGPMVSLTAEEIDQWWEVRDLYPSAREWYLANN